VDSNDNNENGVAVISGNEGVIWFLSADYADYTDRRQRAGVLLPAFCFCNLRNLCNLWIIQLTTQHDYEDNNSVSLIDSALPDGCLAAGAADGFEHTSAPAQAELSGALWHRQVRGDRHSAEPDS